MTYLVTQDIADPSSMVMMCLAAGCFDGPKATQEPPRITLSACRQYVRSKPNPETRARYWSYYGRDQMISCEIEVGRYHYANPQTYYPKAIIP